MLVVKEKSWPRHRLHPALELFHPGRHGAWGSHQPAHRLVQANLFSHPRLASTLHPSPEEGLALQVHASATSCPDERSCLKLNAKPTCSLHTVQGKTALLLPRGSRPPQSHWAQALGLGWLPVSFQCQFNAWVCTDRAAAPAPTTFYQRPATKFCELLQHHQGRGGGHKPWGLGIPSHSASLQTRPRASAAQLLSGNLKEPPETPIDLQYEHLPCTRALTSSPRRAAGCAEPSGGFACHSSIVLTPLRQVAGYGQWMQGDANSQGLHGQPLSLSLEAALAQGGHSSGTPLLWAGGVQSSRLGQTSQPRPAAASAQVHGAAGRGRDKDGPRQGDWVLWQHGHAAATLLRKCDDTDLLPKARWDPAPPRSQVP